MIARSATARLLVVGGRDRGPRSVGAQLADRAVDLLFAPTSTPRRLDEQERVGSVVEPTRITFCCSRPRASRSAARSFCELIVSASCQTIGNRLDPLTDKRRSREPALRRDAEFSATGRTMKAPSADGRPEAGDAGRSRARFWKPACRRAEAARIQAADPEGRLRDPGQTRSDLPQSATTSRKTRGRRRGRPALAALPNRQGVRRLPAARDAARRASDRPCGDEAARSSATRPRYCRRGPAPRQDLPYLVEAVRDVDERDARSRSLWMKLKRRSTSRAGVLRSVENQAARLTDSAISTTCRSPIRSESTGRRGRCRRRAPGGRAAPSAAPADDPVPVRPAAERCS
jgi:hypothetical protein